MIYKDVIIFKQQSRRQALPSRLQNQDLMAFEPTICISDPAYQGKAGSLEESENSPRLGETLGMRGASGC